MTKDELIEALAKVLGGLQVPMSMGPVLGAADKPYREIYADLGGFGWRDDEAFHAYLRTKLA